MCTVIVTWKGAVVGMQTTNTLEQAQIYHARMSLSYGQVCSSSHNYIDANGECPWNKFL